MLNIRKKFAIANGSAFQKPLWHYNSGTKHLIFMGLLCFFLTFLYTFKLYYLILESSYFKFDQI